MSDRIVAILGTAPSSRHMANEQPPEVEIWALNDCWTFLQRPWQRWFEIHGINVAMAEGPEHVEFLKTGVSPIQEKCIPADGAQIMMLDRHDGMPLSAEYPLAAIQEMFGTANNADHPYLASTIDYMIALALYEGVNEIRIYGINHSTATEFLHQRPSCEFWLGVAHGRNIKITIPDHCPLLQAPLYGPKRRGVLDRERLVTRKNRVEYQLQEVDREMRSLDGAVQGFEKLVEEFELIANPVEPTEGEKAEAVALPTIYAAKLKDLLHEAVQRRHQAEMQVQATHGAHQVVEQLINLVDEPILPDEEITEAPLHPKAPITSADGHNALGSERIVLPG